MQPFGELAALDAPASRALWAAIRDVSPLAHEESSRHPCWVVWRFKWDWYLGIQWSEVAEHLLAEGAQINDMAEIRETGWENRENIHFHRFSGDTYLYSEDSFHPAAHIFRADWSSR